MKQSSVLFAGKVYLFNYLVLGGYIGVFTVNNQLRSEERQAHCSEEEQAIALARKLLVNNFLKYLSVQQAVC